MTLRAVLFDFSGTLFRLEEDESWFTDLADADGSPFDLEAQAEVMRRMTAPVGQIVQLEPEFQDAWENRDLDPALHRKVYLEVLRSSGVLDGQAEGLYARLIDTDFWTPYPDAAEVLRRLHEAGIKIAVISNIAFDIRPAFERIGITRYVDEFVLSYLEGVIKPDPKLFLRACERLGVAPAEALMVGDSEEADGGAALVGCRVAIVDPVSTIERPDGLLTAVADVLR
ncbi:HAD family hydrolase [Saccharopolyspora phatthalungensis]|uniref:HAD superfamily hydrolase (TIGR01509 family) n=1 Tax=Saccharopolyspora phatthalungensis TaxID=664693 RepID=A0A840Q1P9_9PSEU|nr:HAD-IA family hydrolase [Saccharopolyspora phatthalungensis]MBB5153927.1 HAD superfamily hydrolase (TIGR01509 family) [Saccharopolyspora phatthalungensis]